ncbi:MAG: 50S ribosomal protein L4 [Candidatus Omnitrophica bacterium]|nr:50S ribosomal protein L4 [Candidatus Omnitrophota bacterium]
MKTKELEIYNQKGKKISKYSLDSKVFDGKVNHDLLNQAVVSHLANKRTGCAKTKRRGEVSGGGIKPWRQKGTGRARVGSIRSPLWRGGGITFGPQPHKYTKKFPQRMKTMALKSALNSKLNDEQLMVIDQIVLDSKKTKGFFEILRNLKVEKTKVKFIIDTPTDNLAFASRNIANLTVSRVNDLSTYMALNCEKIVFTKESLLKIEEKIKKWLK